MKQSWLALALVGAVASAASCSEDSSGPGAAVDSAADARAADGGAVPFDGAADAPVARDGSAADAAIDGGSDAVPTKPGALDLAFGASGLVQTSLVDGTDALQALLVMPDGKLLVAGSGAGSAVFARFTAKGELDPGFSGDGVLVKAVPGATATSIQALALAPGGDVIAAGYADALGGRDVVLIRLRSDGSLDPEFGTNGVAHPDFGGQEMALDVVVRRDGKILVAGSSGELGGRMLLARYTGAGAVDASLFGTGAITFPLGTNGYARKIALLPSGKIVLAGSSGGAAEILQLDGDGAFDKTFGMDGRLRVDVTPLDDQTSGMAVDPAGRVVVVGQVGTHDPPSDTFVLRVTPTGVLDTTFNLSGKATLAVSTDVDTPAAGVVVDGAGRIVLGGRGFFGGSAEMFVLRLLTDGNRDTAFGTGGVARVSAGNGLVAQALALDGAGRIVLAGFIDAGMFDAALVRLAP